MTSNKLLFIRKKPDFNALTEEQAKEIEKIFIYGKSSIDENDLWDNIHKFHNLKELEINYFDSITFPCSEKISQLEALSINHSHDVNINYAYVPLLKKIELFRVKYYHFENDESIKNLVTVSLIQTDDLPFDSTSSVWNTVKHLEVTSSSNNFSPIIKSAQNLEFLSICSVNSQDHFNDIKTLHKLQFLKVNCYDDGMFPSLSNLTHLTSLFVNNINEEGLREIFNSSTIKKLEITSNDLTDFPSDLSEHPSVVELTFDGTRFPDFNYLKAFPKVEKLEFCRYFSKVNRDPLSHDFFHAFTNLKEIKLYSSNAFNGKKGFETFLSIPKTVERFNIISNKSGTEIQINFEKNSALKEFDFSGDNNDLVVDFKYCKQLDELKLSYCNTVQSVINTLPDDLNLRSLTVIHSKDDGKGFFENDPPSIHRLEEINLENKQGLINAQSLLENCTSLKKIKLSSYTESEDLSFIENMKELETIELYSTSDLNLDLGNHPQLKEVEITAGHASITLQKAEHLEKISLELTSGFSNELDKEFFSSPKLESVVFSKRYDSTFDGFETALDLENEENISPLTTLKLPIKKGFQLKGNFDKLKSIMFTCNKSIDNFPMVITGISALESINIQGGNQITSIPKIESEQFPQLSSVYITAQSLFITSNLITNPSLRYLNLQCSDTLEVEKIATVSKVTNLSWDSENYIFNGGFEHLTDLRYTRFPKKVIDPQTNQLNVEGLIYLLDIPSKLNDEANNSDSKGVSFIDGIKDLDTSIAIKEELLSVGFIALKYGEPKGIISKEACINGQLLKGTLIKKYLIESLAYHSSQGEKTLNQNSKVLLLGKFDYSLKEIIEAFQKIGIKATSKIDDQITHVALGKNLRTKLKAFDLHQPFEYQIINSTKVNDVLLNQQEHYLVEDENDKGELTSSIIDLLQPNSEENLLLVISLIENGGVPPSLWHELIYRLKITTNTSIKKSLKKVLLKSLPDEFQVVLNDRKNLDKITRYKESKASSELEMLSRKWGKELLLYCATRIFEQYEKGYYFILCNTDYYDERRKPVMEYLVHNEGIYWQRERVKIEGYFKFPKDLPYFTKVTKIEIKNSSISEEDISEIMKGVKDVEYLNLTCSYLERFEFDSTNVKSLKEINLSDNKLESFPKDLMKVTTLEKINLKKNRFTEIPDEVKKALPNCKIMI
ncbi:hypothetical protein [Flammeovirga sp. SJP92]|uniref:hypothetical protein n=1 Tax=Flammeovirga sp. SJP92 TaxID=1775430 RepID=UPI0007873335|nr:hypothetical protein [Flammeovirga sp. SJP92]KXX70466.1 hypothetical protein AVL50_08900 [Flammeovirga sp. SJP92]